MNRSFLIAALVFCHLLSVQIAHGQTTDKEAYFNNPNISLDRFLNNKLGEEHKKLPWPSCISSSFFAKFIIDSTGNIKTLVFSSLRGTPPELKTTLQFTILSTNGMWVPREINGKKVDSKPFILPFLYDLESGCLVSNSGTTPVYKEVQNSLFVSLIYMLQFDDNVSGKTGQLDCILLKPLVIESAN